MSLAGRSFVVASARGGAYQPGTPRAPYDHQERYLRDFFAGHYAVHDVTFVGAELTNALVDPALAARLDAHHESHAAALAEADALATTMAAANQATITTANQATITAAGR